MKWKAFLCLFIICHQVVFIPEHNLPSENVALYFYQRVKWLPCDNCIKKGDSCRGCSVTLPLDWNLHSYNKLCAVVSKTNLHLFFFSLRKRSSTTFVPSSPRAPARRRRGREQEMKKHLPASPQRRRLAVEQSLRKERRRKKPPLHPTRTSPPSWRGSGRHSPARAPGPDLGGSGGQWPTARALWSPSWPQRSCRFPSLPLRRGTVRPAPTPTAACCLTARCVDSNALLLVSSQVGLTNHLMYHPYFVYVSVCFTFINTQIDCQLNSIKKKTSSLAWNETPEAKIHSFLYFPSCQYQS